MNHRPSHHNPNEQLCKARGTLCQSIVTITLPIFCPVATYANASDIFSMGYCLSITGLKRPFSTKSLTSLRLPGMSFGPIQIDQKSRKNVAWMM